MSQTYMTAQLNLTDGTVIYPQASADNIVTAIDDPTPAEIAIITGGTVPTSELPVAYASTEHFFIRKQ